MVLISLKNKLKSVALVRYCIRRRESLKLFFKNPKLSLIKLKFRYKVREQFSDIKDNTFFIIAIPGCLHILEICLKNIPNYINIIIVSNGLTGWEQTWLSKNLKFRKIIKIPFLYPHGEVIDILIKNIDKPFGIMDYDCFVFDHNLFKEAIVISQNHQLNAFFCYKNKKIDLELPETFFLYINPYVYNQLMKKYRINCNITTYFDLPISVRKKIQKIGILKNQMPEDHKNYFDTLKVLIVLGIADGKKINFIRKFPTGFEPSNEIFHVGGSSDPNNYKNLWSLRGSYLWRFVLENHWDKELRKNYELKFGEKTTDKILDSYPESRKLIGNDFFIFVDNLIP
ncbi:MAG: hypothetical protein CVU40_10045 [Chloroflexi bacterium HGW-Chloroflexi-2]|nr:MAG: hypothetical protein CVU40_10045 [Chloroflexi bacterium HGW-Chloroflexi-2]